MFLPLLFIIALNLCHTVNVKNFGLYLFLCFFAPCNMCENEMHKYILFFVCRVALNVRNLKNANVKNNQNSSKSADAKISKCKIYHFQVFKLYIRASPVPWELILFLFFNAKTILHWQLFIFYWSSHRLEILQLSINTSQQSKFPTA